MEIRSVLFDIDGTLFTGTTPIPGAADAIQYLIDRKIPYRYISNGTRRARAAVLEKLEHLHLPIMEEEIITPAIAAIQFLKKNGKYECTLLSCGDVASDFTTSGITLTDDADVVVIADAGENFSHASINRIFRQIMGGAHLIALEKDRFWMDTDGYTLGAGPFVVGLEYATGATATLIGKPSREFFQMALNRMDAEPVSTLMIGDDINTDIGGGGAAGLMTALVMTGKFRQDQLDHAIRRPDILLPSIADLPGFISPS